MTDKQIVPQGRSTIKPDYGSLRRVLRYYRDKKAYLVWLAVPAEDGKVDKVPCDPVTGQMTAPNSARDRGVLRLDEAIAAAKLLEACGVECGVGVYPPNAGLIAIDLDRCVVVNGTTVVAPWALPIVSESYAEISPSGKGIRMLVSQISEALSKRANGHERNGIGVYGKITNRFVTLTGIPVGPDGPVDVLGLSDRAERAIWARFEAEGAKQVKGMIGAGGADGYPHGQRGMDMALEDILTGASLHPAMVSYLSRAAMLIGLEKARENCLAIYHESDAKLKDPERWAAREGHIDEIVGWLRKQGKFKRDEIPTQKLEAAKRSAMERFGKREVAAPKSAGRFRKHMWCEDTGGFFYHHWGDGGWLKEIPEDQFEGMLAEFEQVRDDYRYDLEEHEIDEFWYAYLVDHGLPVPEVLRKSLGLAGVQQAADEAAIAAEWEQTRAGYAARMTVSEDPQAWLLDDCPSVLLQDLMRHMMARQTMPSYGVACAGALVAGGVVLQNGVIGLGQFETGGNTGAVVVERSGSGKSVTAGIIRAVARIASGTEIIGKPESAQGVYDAMLDGDGKLLVIADEADDYLSAISDPRQRGSHMQKSMSVITEAFPQACGYLEVSASARRNRANPRPASVVGPYINLLMMTTPEHIPGVVSGKLLRGGFFGRVLYLRTPSLARVRPDKVTPGLPTEMVVALKDAAFAFHRPGVVAVMGRAPEVPSWVHFRENGQACKAMRVSDEQYERLDGFRDGLVDLHGDIAGRSGETALRVAVTVAAMMQVDAAGMLGEPLRALMAEEWVVPDVALDWAVRVVGLSVAALVADGQMLEAPQEVAEQVWVDDVKAELAEAVLSKKGPVYEAFKADIDRNVIPARYFGRRIRRRSSMTRRSADAVVRTLVLIEWLEDGEVEHVRGKTRTIYPLGACFGKDV